MANKLYEETYIQAIADSIRGKTGKTDTMTVAEMSGEIDGITAESEPVLQDKEITENGTYTADSGYDGLGTVTVNVEGGSNVVRNINVSNIYSSQGGNAVFSCTYNISQ